MRFLPNGPDVPRELIEAQERGEVLFICGAGVSRPVGLPLFAGLVDSVYEQLGEHWDLYPAEREVMREGGRLAGQYDRVLRCLERRLAASGARAHRGMHDRIRSAVRQALSPPEKADLTNHLVLLELSRDEEGRSRLLTTNFDTLFERAWWEKHLHPIASHAGTAMPQPKVAGFEGVLHLHGRLADPKPEVNLPETDLVLTSAEFGEAYLRSGWASRYVYDLVRAFTIVLVGYQADDPPMRYLLEALESDRERYADLHKVYAFAPAAADEEEIERALWEAKAVEPILYRAVGSDHSPLYETLREWRSYAEDPTEWRRSRLRGIFDKLPSEYPEEELQASADLLRHGDARQLLGELSPKAEWLGILENRRLLDFHKGWPWQWIIKRLDDPEMIQECAALDYCDENARWLINNELERSGSGLGTSKLSAWRLLLSAKETRSRSGWDNAWFSALSKIKQGDTGFEVRHVLVKLLRPSLLVKKPARWGGEAKDASGAERISDLVSVDFEAAQYPNPEEILAAWPHAAEQEIALFRSLDRALDDALDEAENAGFLEPWDRASQDVPSVAPHDQNRYRRGFYPIIAVITGLWTRIADHDPVTARALAKPWEESPYPLIKRLWLFAIEHRIFSGIEVGIALELLDDDTFWLSNAQVELMRVIVSRWSDFASEQREKLEHRLRQGIPQELFPTEVPIPEGEWISIHDNSIYRRLKQIEGSGAALSPDSQDLLREIVSRHPKWAPGTGDRDAFHTWLESHYGPRGQSDKLQGLADDQLVAEAMRLQSENYFDQSDIWRVFCASDPYRALRALTLDAKKGSWVSDAWRCMLWAGSEKDDQGLQESLADMLLLMPSEPLQELLPSAASWLQKKRESLSSEIAPEPSRFFRLWDRLAELTYQERGSSEETDEDGDLLTQAFNRPGGELADALVDALSSLKPKAGSGLGPQLAIRFDRIAEANGHSGLLGRVYLSHQLAFLNFVDPSWVERNMVPRFCWDHSEALHIWRSHSTGNMGSAKLFNALKSAMLQAFERIDLSEHHFEGLASRLLSISLWHQSGNGHKFELTPAEMRRVLTICAGGVRRHIAWNFWRLMGNEEGEPSDRAARWSEVVGPLFRSIWPLDARLRAEDTSRNLVFMALECEAAFPDAVETIADVIVPYHLSYVAHSLRLETKHEAIPREHPAAFLRLLNVLIDPKFHPIPHDLASVLQECLAVDPSIAANPAYIRLYGLRRMLNA